MNFEFFDRKYRNNDHLFQIGEISIGEYQNRQFELLKRYIDELFSDDKAEHKEGE